MCLNSSLLNALIRILPRIRGPRRCQDGNHKKHGSGLLKTTFEALTYKDLHVSPYSFVYPQDCSVDVYL